MERIRHSEHDVIYEALTPERGVEGPVRRAIDYLGLGRKRRRGKSRAGEVSTNHYDVCGRVSAAGLEMLITALRAAEAPEAFALKRRPHDPHDTHSTKLNGWTDLSP